MIFLKTFPYFCMTMDLSGWGRENYQPQPLNQGCSRGPAIPGGLSPTPEEQELLLSQATGIVTWD